MNRGTTLLADRSGLVAALAAVLVVQIGCSPGGGAVSGVDGMDDTAAAAETTHPADTGPPEDTVRRAPPWLGPPSRDLVVVPAVEGPVTTGNGHIVLVPPGVDVTAFGYVEEEYFLSGDATSYTADEPLGEDGRWVARPDEAMPYTTRIIVRRPSQAAAFSGTVVVEWFNVSGGLDAAPDWTFTHTWILRTGAAWVGVSAQEDGIVGGGNPLGAMMALKNVDPVRYGPLDHPGDDFSYDIFSQAGAAVWFAADTVLGGLEPEAVLATGESQSAFRLATYVNGIAPLVDVYDGYLVHSRGASGAPLGQGVFPPDPTLSRTDLEVPVLVLSSETDLVGGMLGYARARQADGPWFAGWEVAGTAHVDAYGLGIGDEDDGSGAADAALFNAMQAPPSDVYFGVMTCDLPINTGPHTYVARAALAALERWAREGTPPPEMPRLELDAAGDDFLRDGAGNALGGIRTPQVDAPVATLSGLGQTGGSFCAIFGTTTPFSGEELVQRYGDHVAFVQAWSLSLDAAVDAGVLLEVDAANLRAVAEASTIGR
ncbi:MAG: alpha/beta hydrolase domain-containing protein [Pseudomonadota bacterium]